MDNFKTYLINKDLAPRTIKRHLWYLKMVLTHAPNFTFEEIDSFFTSLKERGCSNAYLNHISSSLKVYAAFKGLEGFKEHYRFHKQQTSIKATMSDDEIETFLALPCPKSTPRTWWDEFTVFFSCMAYCGLRPNEVACLTINDIDFSQNLIYITQGKTVSSIATVPIPPNLQPILKTYLDNLTGDKLFPTKLGGNLQWGGVVQSTTWGRAFHKRINILGIKRPNLTPYSLRHSYCTTLLSNDVNVFDAKRLMRHKRLETTEHYYHYTVENLRKAQAKHPLIRRNSEPKVILQALVNLVKSFKIEDDTRFGFRIEENDNSVRFEVYVK